ncbi:unnamed protein product [Somion occarium]|uniref:Uncharacterized protein n=1 Tax=Somion occarium TaxID=3059160 RepID=A0ABP1E2X4_9APHY
MDPEHPGVVAVTRRSTNNVQAEGEPITSVYSINLESEDPESVFSLISEFPSARYPIIMHGSRFLSANHITNTTQVIDTESGDLICVLCTPLVNNDPTLSGFEDFRCLDAVVWQQFVLIFRQNWIHLYKIPNRSQASTLHSNSPDHPPEIRPVATHKWPWRIDSLEVSTHDSFVSRHARFMSQPLPPNQPPMINILLRFDSWYPWPVNTLHHYTLSPCSSYHRSSAVLPYLAADSIPFMETSITSHMRLFTPSDLTIGQYGTALWIDAQSDLTSSTQAGDLGQRLAGKVLRSERDSSWDSDRPLLKPGLPGVLLLTNELEENMGTSGSLVPVMVFGVWETHSEWSKVAVEEGEGRIALGSVEGRICVMDYVPRGMEL